VAEKSRISWYLASLLAAMVDPSLPLNYYNEQPHWTIRLAGETF
jgi:hypothetical protein